MYKENDRMLINVNKILHHVIIIMIDAIHKGMMVRRVLYGHNKVQ
jgi:hypothetical protein